ncbi:MAG TPA: hypothetical protein DHW02_20440, partial [Ktedonobacter sp.]|nr:hypothetical protein [Ktedonobacter sp.]
MEYNAREELLKKLKKQQRLREDIPWERCIKYLREKFGITGDMAPYVQIRLLRSKLNLTQEEMMVLFDADEASKISRWERQINVPRAAARENLFKYFGIPVDAWDIQNEKKFIPQRSLHEREKDYPPIWNIPFDEPSLFVGREDVLQHLYNAFSSEKVLSLTQAVSGLGGVGKTSTVLRYVYKYRGEYQAIWWIDASTQESLMAGLLSLAKQIRKIPDSKSQESSFVLDIVKKWMKETPHWLLVLDNVDDIALVYNNDIFPTSRRGHILLTTRTQSVGSSIQNIELESLNSENGALLLLNTAGLMNANKTLYDVVEQDRQNALHLSHLVGGLPLALTYAGAYIREVQCSLAAYIRLYESREMELLRWRSSSYINKKFAYPNSVATTWTLSFEKVEQSSPAAVDLLRLYSFLSPDAIPEEIAIDGSSRLGFNLQGVRDTFAFDQVIVELRRYSLVNRNAENRTVNIHRLVQIVFRDRMDVEIQREWVERTIG